MNVLPLKLGRNPNRKPFPGPSGVQVFENSAGADSRLYNTNP